MLAREAAQIEQPRLHPLEPLGVEGERGAGLGQRIFGFGRLDHRTIERGERRCQCLMFVRDAVEPSRRLPQARQRAGGTVEVIRHAAQLLGEPRALLHRCTLACEHLFFAGFGGQLAQFGDTVLEPFAVALGGLEIGLRGSQCRLGLAPTGVGRSDGRRIESPEGVEQRAMTARREQPTIVMLAMDLDQPSAELAQQRGRNRLVVDAGAAAAVGLDDPAHDKGLAGLALEAVVGQQRGDHGIAVDLEARGHHRLRRAVTDQRGLGALAEGKPQSVEQDRLARTGFASERTEPSGEIEVERLDQHDVANGQPDQHWPTLTRSGGAREQGTNGRPFSRRHFCFLAFSCRA